MTNEEAYDILCGLAERRMLFHVGGEVRKARPDYIDEALACAIEALKRECEKTENVV